MPSLQTQWHRDRFTSFTTQLMIFISLFISFSDHPACLRISSVKPGLMTTAKKDATRIAAICSRSLKATKKVETVLKISSTSFLFHSSQSWSLAKVLRSVVQVFPQDSYPTFRRYRFQNFLSSTFVALIFIYCKLLAFS